MLFLSEKIISPSNNGKTAAKLETNSFVGSTVPVAAEIGKSVMRRYSVVLNFIIVNVAFIVDSI